MQLKKANGILYALDLPEITEHAQARRAEFSRGERPLRIDERLLQCLDTHWDTVAPLLAQRLTPEDCAWIIAYRESR